MQYGAEEGSTPESSKYTARFPLATDGDHDLRGTTLPCHTSKKDQRCGHVSTLK